MQEILVWFLGQEEPLEEDMATHSSIPAWRIPHGQRSLAGYNPWGRKKSDMTEQLIPNMTLSNVSYNSIEIMISSMFSMSVSYISWFSNMKPTLYSWDIINFVIIFYACFILQNHFSNGLRFYFNMKEIIPKYFFSKSKCLIIVKSMIWLRQGCTELLRIPRGSWLKKQNTWCSCSCCRLVAVIKSD